MERCCATRLQSVRSGWVPTVGRELDQEPLVLAVDPTSKQDDLVALAISGVYRQHAIPVAWHTVGSQERGSWIDHFCLWLRLLAPAVPASVPVPGLGDLGLGSRDLWARQTVGTFGPHQRERKYLGRHALIFPSLCGCQDPKSASAWLGQRRT